MKRYYLYAACCLCGQMHLTSQTRCEGCGTDNIANIYLPEIPALDTGDDITMRRYAEMCIESITEAQAKIKSERKRKKQ